MMLGMGFIVFSIYGLSHLLATQMFYSDLEYFLFVIIFLSLYGFGIIEEAESSNKYYNLKSGGNNNENSES
tara:strand:+ start:6282 stop:6494 length:213 start_codon:yes stop_codon:yes gene_type:complete